ncbi:hypothetical protein Ancab_037330 [Ancistrocladus abbreviatus]
MNDNRDEYKPCCYFHPKEEFVGVCPLCLKERLLILAAKEGLHHHHHHHRHHQHNVKRVHSSNGTADVQRKPSFTLAKMFAFGSLLHRRKSNDSVPDHQDASTSLEDSFISIKFGENGVASWEKGKVSKVTLEHCNMSWSSQRQSSAKEPNHRTKSVVEHAKPRTTLRWRNRIGQLFQLIRWKRSNKGAANAAAAAAAAAVPVCSSKMEGVIKVRKSCIRRRTT